ncbi:MAG: hypothetical protein ABR548_02605 [Actinomycetota bacterium]|nr:hypothetical protein [Actinomycetota bacterium]
MRSFTRLFALALSLCVLAPVSGQAAPIRVRFDHTQAYRDCHEGTGSTCGSSARALLSGHFGLDSYMISPSSGKAPGTGYTDGTASVTSVYSLRKAVKSLAVSGTLRIDAASVRHTGVLNGRKTGLQRPNASVYLVLSAWSMPCAKQCPLQGFAFKAIRLLDLQHGPFSISKKTYKLKTVLRPMAPQMANGTKGRRPKALKKGKVYISINLSSAAELGARDRAVAESSIFGLPKCADQGCKVKPYDCYGPDCAASIRNLLYRCLDQYCTDTPMERVFSCPTATCPVSPEEQTLPDSGVARAVVAGSFLGTFIG